MKLQKHVFALGAALLLAATSQLSALTIGDANYLGSITPDHPASPANEVTYINWLTTLAAGAAPIAMPDSTGQTYSRVGSTIAGPFPTAIALDVEKYDPVTSLTVDATGFSYVLGKYAADKAGALVWYFPGGASGNVTLPEFFDSVREKYEISHITVYKGRGTSVPDGGTTAMLLGLALSGIALLRRYIS